MKDQLTLGILKKFHRLPELCYVVVRIRHHPDHFVSLRENYSLFYLDRKGPYALDTDEGKKATC
jgi:hypothetical protein